LAETGYVVGRNVTIEYRLAENQFDRLPELAVDLVRRRVAVIVASGTAAALAAKRATATIPIVFGTAGDPVALGLVASLNRPGANLTGTATLREELTPKLLQLLRELMPNTARFGVLSDPAYPTTESITVDLQAAARTLGLQIVVVPARTDSDLEPAFATLSQQRVGAVLVGTIDYFNAHPEQITAQAARNGMPAIFPYREFALVGGLLGRLQDRQVGGLLAAQDSVDLRRRNWSWIAPVHHQRGISNGSSATPELPMVLSFVAGLGPRPSAKAASSMRAPCNIAGRA
jgi:putative ABC transport system substrate-binding protein